MIDLPSKTRSPLFGVYSRLTQLNSVVLPAPLGPISPTMWPGAMSKETSSRATIPPKRIETFRTDRISAPTAAFTVRIL